MLEYKQEELIQLREINEKVVTEQKRANQIQDKQAVYKHFLIPGYTERLTAVSGFEEAYLFVKFVTANVGSELKFGNDIEWIVMDRTDDKLLLVSKYNLAEKSYHKKYDSISWENSSIRSWLNEEFVKSDFCNIEADAIVEVTISNPDNPKYGTKGGPDTMDKVFLLSLDEIERYFSSESKRLAKSLVGDLGWWLRSPGDDSNYAAYVDQIGSVTRLGRRVDSILGIRPALWIDYTKLI